jgi:hypothetical protein
MNGRRKANEKARLAHRAGRGGYSQSVLLKRTALVAGALTAVVLNKGRAVSPIACWVALHGRMPAAGAPAGPRGRGTRFQRLCILARIPDFCRERRCIRGFPRTLRERELFCCF